MRGTPAWLLILLPLLLVCACDELPNEPGPDGLEPQGSVYREWRIYRLKKDEALNAGVAVDEQRGGIVEVVRVIGGMVTPPAPEDSARAEVFSNETGQTFWAGAQSPSPWGLLDPDSAIGSHAALRQVWRFRKNAPDATFELVVTDLVLEVIDHNGTGVEAEQCGWGWDASPPEEIVYRCATLLKGTVSSLYWAYPDTLTTVPFFSAHTAPQIEGWGPHLTAAVSYSPHVDEPFISISDLEIEQDGTRHVTARLRAPVRVEFPLDTIPVGGVFEVGARLDAKAWSRRQGESYVGAYLRDPGKSGGLALEFTGLTMLPPPDEVREPTWSTEPAPPCSETGAAGAGGTIQFDRSAYHWAEWPGDVAEIPITRTGGGEGTASALFTVSGGTADPGADFEPVTMQVRFADGEIGTRVAYVPIRADTVAEPDETALMTLASPGGCASLGASAATLTILDDDHLLPDAGFTIGGTVMGLEGSGLVLTNLSTDHLTITADGPFTFGRDYPRGHVYQIRVETQPDGPAQSCTVENGSGTVDGADVTDVAVTCETLVASDHLDPSFGTGGKVSTAVSSTGFFGEATDVALQADGKLVAVGGNRVVRFGPDGFPDPGFGTAGEVTVEFYASAYDRLTAVAVQPDGRIVVAGYSKDGVNSPTQEDFVVARLETDGALDGSFGTDGRVVTDFENRGDGAYDVLIQPDGAIVVTGHASVVDSFGSADSDLAAVRYTSAGELDAGFGAGGRATADVAGRTDIGYASALQSDGGILVAGRVANGGGDDPDIGLVRFAADGSLDTGFGEDGVVRPRTGSWDEAADVVVQPDGRILVTGYVNPPSLGTAVPDTLILERYEPDGSPDPTFGIDGRVASPVMTYGRALALQPDGRIVVAGLQIGEDGDFAIARFHPGGQLDTTFGADGLIQVDFYGALDYANAVLIQPDGRIVVAGSARSGTSSHLGLARVVP